MADIDGILDDVEKKFRVTSLNAGVEFRGISSGQLVTDLILSGGIRPGAWYTMYGAEQSSKSTYSSTVLASAIKSNIKLLSLWDYEGSFSPEYFENIVGNSVNIGDLFGIKDKNGKWVVKPRVRHYSESIGDLFFNVVSSMLRNMPDREEVAGKWYEVWPPTKTGRKRANGNHVKKYYSKFGKLYVPLPEDTNPIQMLILLDSYPAMNPESQDDDDGNKSMALRARMFADGLPKILGKLRKKAITVIGVNQLRLKPATMFGSPEYEACGEALKFSSSVRMKFTPRAIPHKKGQFEEEPSVQGKGTDTYRYVHMRATKNKLSTPYLEGWQRLWVSNRNLKGMGYCPVWDTFQYLKSTGQITGTMKKMELNLGKLCIKKLKWLDFKRLILLEGKELKKICKELGLKNNPKIRKECFKQMKKSVGMDLYIEALSNKQVDDDDDDD